MQLAGITRYFTVRGRAGRKEYWLLVLGGWGVLLAIGLLDVVFGLVLGRSNGLIAAEVIGVPGYLTCLVAVFATAVRRMHDTNRSGLMLLVALIPVIGGIWALILLCTSSDPNDNEYGPSGPSVRRQPANWTTPGVPQPYSPTQGSWQ